MVSLTRHSPSIRGGRLNTRGLRFVCIQDEIMRHGRAVVGIGIGGKTRDMIDERRKESIYPPPCHVHVLKPRRPPITTEDRRTYKQ
jgi:hypothetical protein